MKKIFLILAVLCMMGGCVEEEIFMDYAYWGATDYSAPYFRYEFPSIDKGTEDLVVYLTDRNAFESNAQYYADPGFSGKLLVISAYTADESKQNIEQSAFFERLAVKYQDTPLEFAILVINDNPEKIKSLSWVKNIRQVKIYYTGSKFYNLATYGAETPSIIAMRQDRPHVSQGWPLYEMLRYKDSGERSIEDFLLRVYGTDLEQ